MRKFLKNWLKGNLEDPERPPTRKEPTFSVPKQNVETEHADEVLLEDEDWGNNNLDEPNHPENNIEVVNSREQENEKNPDIFKRLDKEENSVQNNDFDSCPSYSAVLARYL